MKQKHTLNIADMQISVVTDAPPREVERIRGLLDRKMREIYLKSRCPKTEAALLCAMEFAADRLCLKEQVETLDKRCAQYERELEACRQQNAAQASELEKLRNENAVLRSLLAPDALPAAAPDPISPAAFFAEVAEAQHAPAELSEDAQEASTNESDVSGGSTAEPTAEEPARNRSRVGSMFEQLSFGDIG